jgi:integrase
LAWITQQPASNNTVRARLSTGRAFLRWCYQTGTIDTQPWETLPNITKQYPTTYGKVQDTNPARFLTHAQAFGDLIGACQNGSDIGLRDELAIRLGLAGMRVHEIASLTLADVAQLPTLTWMGKGHRPRTATAGTTLCEVIRHWLELRRANGASTHRNAALLLPTHTGNYTSHKPIDWTATEPVHQSTLYRVVTTRAKIAGLGHVAPHDLRRSAAAILHHSTTADGAHTFDLLDIQKVLGHADPATTMRSYLDPMDSGVQDRAASVLD